MLLIASLVGVAVAIPMVLELFKSQVQNAPPTPIPLPLLVLIGLAQNLILLGLAIGVGLLLGRTFGLGAPLLESWLYHKESPVTLGDSARAGALVGIAVGIVLVIIILPITPYLPGLPFATAARAPIWKRVLVCFYGGIDEEVLTRLFLLTLVAWLATKLFSKQKAKLSAGVFWAANIIVAVIFGLGHLPSASLVMHITPVVVLLAVVLNAIAAIPFGYLYWKKGLESAMIAHFCADFVVYVVGVMFLKN